MRHYREVKVANKPRPIGMEYFKVKLLPNGWHVISTRTNITHSLYTSFEEANACRRGLQHASKRKSLLEKQRAATAASLAKRKGGV